MKIWKGAVEISKIARNVVNIFTENFIPVLYFSKYVGYYRASVQFRNPAPLPSVFRVLPRRSAKDEGDAWRATAWGTTTPTPGYWSLQTARTDTHHSTNFDETRNNARTSTRVNNLYKHSFHHDLCKHFYCAMHYIAKRGLAIACRLSVCLWRWWIMTT